jgi:hypothetical protein
LQKYKINDLVTIEKQTQNSKFERAMTQITEFDPAMAQMT